MNGRLMLVCTTDESSIFAFSAASVSRCIACLSFAQIDALIAAELIDEPVDDALVVIVAAEMRVAVGRLDFEDAVADLEDRDVERSAAEIPNEDRLVALFFETVGERRRRRLVDDAQHFESGDLAGVFGRLPL